MPKSLKVEDFGKRQGEQLTNVDMADLVPFPPPYDEIDDQPEWREIKSEQKENNWTFLQPLMLTLEYCAKCQTCIDACHTYQMSGKNDLYRPTYRAEVW